MAKKAGRRKTRATDEGGAVGNAGKASGVMIGFAEELGRILGTTERKATEWMQQRESITKQLTQIRDTASRYLTQLTGGGANMAAAVRRGRRGRPPGSKNKQASPKGRSRKQRRSQMSAAQRKAVGERMRKYWAARRKAEAKS